MSREGGEKEASQHTQLHQSQARRQFTKKAEWKTRPVRHTDRYTLPTHTRIASEQALAMALWANVDRCS